MDINFAAFHLHAAVHRRAVIAEVGQVRFHVPDALVHHGGIIDHRRFTDLAEKAGQAVCLVAGPVVDGQEGVPVEQEGTVRFLPDIGTQLGGSEGRIIRLNGVLRQTILSVTEGARRTAGDSHHPRKETQDDISAIHSCKINIFPAFFRYICILL